MDLLAALNNQADLTKTAQYFNASSDKKEAYDQAFADPGGLDQQG